MTLTQLHYVLTIAETGSFNKAAQILYVSQPSLSNAIHDLEDEFSITIFYRSGRGVTLTNEGVEFTKTIAATKGRASYLGERSIGHQDPGATSATMTLEVIRDFLKG